MKNILRNDHVAGFVGVNAVGLHEGTILIHMQEQKRHQLEFVLGCQGGEDSGEWFDVIGAIVWRKGNAQQDKRDFRGLDALNHLIKVVASGINREAAQTVITAEFKQYESRMSCDDVVNASQAVGSGVAAYTLVFDAVFKTGCVDDGLKRLGITPA